jgi:hypothetical protein
MAALDPTPKQNEGPNVVNIPKKGGGFLSFLKHLVVFVLLVGVIVASFWVSFSLGKRLLVPVKKMPGRQIEVAIPEPPASVAALQEFEEIILEEKEEEVQPEPSKPQPAKPEVVKKRASPPDTKYYKVQAGVFGSKTNASDLAKKLRASGIDTFIRKVSQGWRVQAGAYMSKKWALNQQHKLKAKGFESRIIYE